MVDRAAAVVAYRMMTMSDFFEDLQSIMMVNPFCVASLRYDSRLRRDLQDTRCG